MRHCIIYCQNQHVFPTRLIKHYDTGANNVADLMHLGSMTIECIFDIFEDSDKLQVQVRLKNENIIVSLKPGQERKRVITIVPRKECVE
jgi:hypothetical protein